MSQPSGADVVMSAQRGLTEAGGSRHGAAGVTERAHARQPGRLLFLAGQRDLEAFVFCEQRDAVLDAAVCVVVDTRRERKTIGLLGHIQSRAVHP